MKNIVIMICGSISAYKVVDLISLYKKDNYNVNVIASETALKFIGKSTLEIISGNPVYTKLFIENDLKIFHIDIAKNANLIIVIPATYNTINKVANGIANDLMTTIISASTADVIVVPAMNHQMYNKKMFQENIKKLTNLGFYFLLPTTGKLACGDNGIGKLIDIDDVYEYSLQFLNHQSILKDKQIIITAGTTQTFVDPITYMTTTASGRLGWNISFYLSKYGANVILITSNANQPQIQNVKIIFANKVNEFLENIQKYYQQSHALIMCAAISNWTPLNYSKTKLKKADTKLTLTFKKEIDILDHLRENKKILHIGCAAESENIIENAIRKKKEKKLDAVIANSLDNFGTTMANLTWISQNKKQSFSGNKQKAGEFIAKKVVEIIIDK